MHHEEREDAGQRTREKGNSSGSRSASEGIRGERETTKEQEEVVVAPEGTSWAAAAAHE